MISVEHCHFIVAIYIIILPRSQVEIDAVGKR
jgi:hypothetical protein